MVERAVEAIQQAHNGRIGDGKIFVSTTRRSSAPASAARCDSTAEQRAHGGLGSLDRRV